MTKICLRNPNGTLVASITTHHDEKTFIRDLVADNLKAGGVFGGFGIPGRSITVENMSSETPGAGKLERLSSGYYTADKNEPNIAL